MLARASARNASKSGGFSASSARRRYVRPSASSRKSFQLVMLHSMSVLPRSKMTALTCLPPIGRVRPRPNLIRLSAQQELRPRVWPLTWEGEAPSEPPAIGSAGASPSRVAPQMGG